MSFNPLKVSLENIIPLTEARDHFSQIVNEVQKDKLYVLTKGGKPAVAIIDVKYLEHITGGEANVDEVKEEIQKAPEKVGLPPMVKHDNPTPMPHTPFPAKPASTTPPPKTDYTTPKPYPSAPPPPKSDNIPPKPTPAPTPAGQSPLGGAPKTDYSFPKPASIEPKPTPMPTPPSPMTTSPTPPKPSPTPPSPMTQPVTPSLTTQTSPPKPDNSSFIETTAGESTSQADKLVGSKPDDDNQPVSHITEKTPAPQGTNQTIDVDVTPDSDDIAKDQKAAAAAIDRTNPDDKPGPATYTGANDAHEEPDDMVID